MAKDPISVEAISDWLHIDCPEDIEPLIDSALGLVEEYTGIDYAGKGERIEYIRDWPEVITLPCGGRACEDLNWTLEVHKDGLWTPLSGAEQIGDTLCVGGQCACDCDCNACEGAPQLRLITWQGCGKTPAFVNDFVRRYTAYHYMNRGDAPDVAAEKALMKPLYRHMPIAAC